MNKKMTRSVKSCFTLIEPLVMIAIIAILAGMLPVLQNARESATPAQCLNLEK